SRGRRRPSALWSRAVAARMVIAWWDIEPPPVRLGRFASGRDCGLTVSRLSRFSWRRSSAATTRLSLADPPQTFVLGPQAERGREPLARADVELAVHVSQVPLHRLDGHELALRDFAVGETFGSQRRHTVLAGGQRFASGEQPPITSGTRAGGD